MNDLRWALRMLWRTPAVTAAAVLALALGIGANTAIFSVVNGVLLRPLPFPDAGSLHRVYMGVGKQVRFDEPMSWPQVQDVMAQVQSIQSLGAWNDGDVNLTGDGEAERVLVRAVLPSLLPTLGVQPAAGRNFAPDEAFQGRNRVALVSHGLAQRRFAGVDPLGKSLQLDGDNYRIVGVLPRGLQLDRPADVWLPLATDQPGIQVKNSHFLSVVVRLRPGATAAALDAELQLVARRLSERFPDMFPASFGLGFQGRPYLEALVGEARLPLYVLLAAVIIVLAITCANVANLLLARAAARQREVAIRAALGASRGRLIRQLLSESLVLALAGAALGVLFAIWGIDALLALSPPSLPRLNEVRLDWRVLQFTGGVAVATGVAFGLAPAIAESRPQAQAALKQGMFGSTAGRGRLRRALVIGQVAISLVLLVGAGLMVRSFARLRGVDPGFRPDHALTLRVSLPGPDGPATDADRARFRAFYDRALTRLRQLPGVTAAGAGDIVPLEGRGRGRLIDLEGYVRRDSGDMPSAQHRLVTPGWFAALGMPLIDGRDLAAADGPQAPVVVVVNQSFVKRFYPDGRALGRRIRLGKLTSEFPWGTIVGIAADVRGRKLDQPPRPEMYWSAAQVGNTPALAIVARTAGEPAALLQAARAAVAEVDPTLPVFGLQTLEQLLSASLGERRFLLTLMLVFSLLALVLAAVGIYGVTAYGVAQRTREIGIRLALGARPARVLGMVVSGGMTLVAAGTVIGTVAALAVARVASSLLYGISPTDAGTYGAIAVALAAVALIAILLPARRAMRVDPMQAFRAD